MANIVTKILGDKNEWKIMEARANALPRDYRLVYSEIKPYLWKFASGDREDIVAALKEVLRLFEAGGARGRSVLGVTGKNIAAFCHERVCGTPPYMDRWRDSLDRDVAKKLAE